MAGKIFINYRRKLSLPDARHLATLLERQFGRGRVFIDIKGLDEQPNWLAELQKQVAGSIAMVSVICPGWTEVKDDAGQRRLDSANDFVRFELAQAFMRGIPVVPVLVDGASFPAADRLTPDLLSLTLLPQAELLRSASFEADAEKIGRRVKREIASRAKRGVPGWAVGLVGLGALAGGVAAAPVVLPLAGITIGDPDAAAQATINGLKTQIDLANGALAPAKADVVRLTGALRTAEADAEAQRRLADDRFKALEAAKSQATAAGAELTKAKAALASDGNTAKAKLAAAEQAAADAKAALAQAEAARSAAVKERDAGNTALAQAKAASKDANEGLKSATEKLAAVEADKAKLQLALTNALATPPAKPDRAPGTEFQDTGCPGGCPVMVVLPRTTTPFTMGSNDGETDEKPPHPVSIGYDLAVGKYEVTFAQWDACVDAGGCKTKPEDTGNWGRDDRPVINVSWDMINKEYLPWLENKTGHKYRLLHEAEWEYAARAGSDKAYSWGDEIGKNRANCYGCGSQWDNKQTAPVGSFVKNKFGLHDMHGNVWEWVQDCYVDSYKDAPNNGDAAKETFTDCFRVLRGGSWNDFPPFLRAAVRDRDAPAGRDFNAGFRLSRSL
jgi:formylglycine-generating enzyme required for sulfatase activity